MVEFTEKSYKKAPPSSGYVLAGDIGGTHSDFGVFKKVGSKLTLFFSLHVKSKDITDFSHVVKSILTHIKITHNISIKKACFAAAGIRTSNNICMTNRNFCIDLKKIQQRTSITKAKLINDFEAISYGIPVMRRNQFMRIKDGDVLSKQPKIVIGAGTGLGKGFLIYDNHQKSYQAYPSEGGHSDAVAIGDNDRKLFSFIQKETGKEVLEWEDLVSGRGIENLYHYVGHVKKYKLTKYGREIHKAKSEGLLISKYKHVDARCKETYKYFIKFYARCAKNFALDLLSFGGVYIAGGIAADNPEPFTHTIFTKEFLNTKKQKQILTKIPVILIKDYNISLYGAAAALN